jgi:transcriptional regulator with XRE-family HTH domain
VRRPSYQLGEIIRRHREINRLTLRQFAALAGISNPYLSQIERGLRTPSAEVVQAIAKSLEIKLDDLYAEAGITEKPEPVDKDGRARMEAVLLADPALSARHRRVLLEVYDGLVLSSTARRAQRPHSADEIPSAEE